MQQLNRKASFRRSVLACVLTGAFGLLSATTSLAAGAPPLPPPKPVAPLPLDPNAPTTPPEEKVQAPTAAVAMPPADPDQVAQGQQLYKGFCQKCHGINLVSPGGAFFDLRNFPHDDKARFISSVTNGKRAMPAWGALIKPAEIELLWAYVASYKPQ